MFLHVVSNFSFRLFLLGNIKVLLIFIGNQKETSGELTASFDMTKENLVLSQNQWDEILKWIPNNEQKVHDEKILEYLQQASAEMKSKWPENNKKADGKKAERSLKPEILRYEAIKNANPAKRREMIEEAEKFVSSRKIKECPIELRSAAILSENLYGNKLQLEFQAAQKKEEKAKTLLRNQHDMLQSVAWLQDGFEHRTNAHRIACQHKRELLESINQRKVQRDEEKAKRIAEELRNINQHNKNGEDQKIRDRKAKEEQNEYMRKHEVETVLMAKQKREHIKRENEVIDVLAKVHNEGKNRIKELIKNQENESRLERIKLNAKLGEMAKLRHVVEAEKLSAEQKLIEEARLAKEIIADKRDVSAKGKREFLKTDRMKDYSESLKAKGIKAALKKEEDKEYFKTRIMNDEVSREFSKLRKAAKEKRTRENLDYLKAQAKEVRLLTRQEHDEGIKEFNKTYYADTSDQKFFDFAQDLTTDAEGKNRPTKPIFQVTKAYKNRHFIDIKKKTRPHEISNVPIGPLEIEPMFLSDKGKSKRRLKYERDEKLMGNVYRSTKFINVD